MHDSVHDQLSSRSISGLTLTDQSQFRGIESLYLPTTPSSELLESIYHEYEVSEFSTYLDSVFSVSDIRFQWNWATIDVTTDSDYFVTIPLVDEQYILKGFLMFYNMSDHSHFDIVPIQEIETQTSNYTEYAVGDMTFVLANKMNFLRYLYFGGEINRVSEWCRNFVKLNMDKVETRNFVYNVLVVEFDSSTNTEKITVYGVREKCSFIGHQIWLSGGGGGGPISDNDWWDIDVWGWDDEDEPINPENNDEDEDEETKECEKEFFSPALVALLNSLDALYPCAEDIAEVRRQIKEELCDLAGTNIAFGTGASGGDGKLGVEDLEQLLATGDFAWEEELDDEYREYVAELKSQNLVNPCNPGEDVVDAALALMEDNGGCGIEDLDAALLNLAVDCDDFDICSSSFDDYTPTGNGATVNLTCVKALVIAIAIPPIDTPCYELNDLCITTGQFEIDEQNNLIDMGGVSNARKYLTAQAFDKAGEKFKNEMIERIENGEGNMSDQEANAFWKYLLTEELGKLMTGVSVSSGPCDGEVGTAEPRIDVFGFCLPTTCDC